MLNFARVSAKPAAQVCASMEDHTSRAILQIVDKTHAVIHFRPDGTILTANANFLMATGYTLDEITGRNHSLFVSPDYANSADYRQF